MKLAGGKWKSREVALLVLPALALVAFGFVMRREPGLVRITKTGKFALTIDEIKREPATPLEVFKGYDTRVTVKYTMPESPQIAGAQEVGVVALAPLSMRLVQRTGEVESVLRLPGITAPPLIQDLESTTFLFRLSQVPVSDSELTFKAYVRGGHAYDKASNGMRVIYTTSVPISVVVRRAGERVQVPAVSKYRPFKLETMKVEALTRWESRAGGNTRVTATVRCTEEPPIEGFNDKCRFWRSRLVDASGKEYISFNTSMTVKNMAQILTEQSGEGGDERTCIRSFRLPLERIPKSGGQVTFKTEVSINDGWPLPLSVVVRER